MSAVPALCATSTLGAAALGFAFGYQVPQTLSSPQVSRQNDIQHDIDAQSVPFRYSSHLVFSSRTAPRHNTALSGSNEVRTAWNAAADLEQARQDKANTFTHITPDGRVESSEDLVTKSNANNHLQRSDSPRPSRLRRLSTLRLSRQSRPSTGDSHASRSSILSFAFEGPPLPNAEGNSPLGRNKLVKRSLTVQHISNSSTESAGTDSWTLKRPATRHQRSEIIQQNRLTLLEDSPSNSRSAGLQDVIDSKGFIADITDCEEEMPVPESNFKQVNGERFTHHMKSVPSVPPTLVVVKSVHPTGESVVCSVDEQLYSPIFQKSVARSALVSSSISQSPRVEARIDRESRPQRSLSISGLLAKESRQRNTLQKRQRRASPDHTHPPLNGRRAFSAPLSNMQISDSSDFEHESDFENSRTDNFATHSSLPYQPAYNGTPESAQNSQSTSESANSAQQPRASCQATPVSQPVASPPSDVSTSSNKVKRFGKRSRISVTPSELTSDSGTRIFDDEGDIRSDTHFDSLRTALTSSSTGRQATRLETLFDRDSDTPLDSATKLTPSSPSVKRPSHISEESEGITTPVRGEQANDCNTPRSNRRLYSPEPDDSISSGKLSPKPLSLGRLAWDTDGIGEGEVWSSDDDKLTTVPSRKARHTLRVSPPPQGRGARFVSPDMSPSPSAEYDKKSTLFDWAEQQAPERGSNDHTPPRPKTVHGKKNLEGIGSRVNRRTTQSGLHVRSQSVPALQDLVSARPSIMNKFGTWGIGSKGVTEDWDDDFDFDNSDPTGAGGALNEDTGVEDGEGPTMIVPKIIQAQQRNVLANIGLLREWGLLIEELKELRMKVVNGGINGRDVLCLFDEIDAMIELADHEVEDDLLPSKSSLNSTPNFDRDLKRRSFSLDVDANNESQGMWQEPDIDENDDYENINVEMQPNRMASVSPIACNSPLLGTRPRQNSEAVARSVIQAIQKKRAPPDNLPEVRQYSTPIKKLPFDTATLKHIVPYVNGLVRRAKQVLRDAEKLSSTPSPQRSSKEPALARAFVFPGSSPV